MIDRLITGDLGVNTYFYSYNNSDTIIVDPGAETEAIIYFIEKKGSKPTGILLTHGHFDHIGAVEELRKHFNIPVMIHKDDATFLGECGEKRHWDMFESMGPSGDFYFNTYYRYTQEADIVLSHGDMVLESGLKVIHTPGHSPGSICLYNEQEHLLISGDTLFCNGLGRTDFTGGDHNTLIESLTRLKDLPGDTQVFPGHGTETTIRRELG